MLVLSSGSPLFCSVFFKWYSNSHGDGGWTSPLPRQWKLHGTNVFNFVGHTVFTDLEAIYISLMTFSIWLRQVVSCAKCNGAGEIRRAMHLIMGSSTCPTCNGQVCAVVCV